MEKISEADLAEVWAKFKQFASQKYRNQLLEFYWPLVKNVAGRLSYRLLSFMEVDELAQIGFFGLLQALEGFDSSRGVKFETYAMKRIRGSILDELRRRDWVPRLVRIKAIKLGKARKTLEVELGRTPNIMETVEELDITLDEYLRLSEEGVPVAIGSLSDERVDEDSKEGKNLLRLLEDGHSDSDPTKGLIQEEEVARLIRRGNLTQNEALVMSLYFLEERQIKEIARRVRLTESRISQIMTKAGRKLELALTGTVRKKKRHRSNRA